MEKDINQMFASRRSEHTRSNLFGYVIMLHYLKKDYIIFPIDLKMNSTFYSPKKLYDDPTFGSATLAFLLPLPLEADALLPGGGFFFPGLLFMLIRQDEYAMLALVYG